MAHLADSLCAKLKCSSQLPNRSRTPQRISAMRIEMGRLRRERHLRRESDCRAAQLEPVLTCAAYCVALAQPKALSVLWRIPLLCTRAPRFSRTGATNRGKATLTRGGYISRATVSRISIHFGNRCPIPFIHCVRIWARNPPIPTPLFIRRGPYLCRNFAHNTCSRYEEFGIYSLTYVKSHYMGPYS